VQEIDRSQVASRRCCLTKYATVYCVHATVQRLCSLQTATAGTKGRIRDQGRGQGGGSKGGKGNTRDDKREEVRSKYDGDDDDQHGKEK
jgi:hypothetical protein